MEELTREDYVMLLDSIEIRIADLADDDDWEYQDYIDELDILYWKIIKLKW